MTHPPVVERPLFLLDYDGTLAEIVDDPAQARPHPEALQLLRELGARHPLRVVTGRSVRDLAELLDAPGLVVVGVHGMEEGRLGGEVRPRLGPAETELLERARAALPNLDGVRAEDKGAAIALHYRGARDEEAVLEGLREWAEELPEGLEASWGKKVVEVRPGGWDKGRAARELAADHPGTTPVVLGDDTTDEDAFRALPAAVTVKVGPGPTSARYRLPGVDEVISYLRAYLAR